MKPWLKRLLIVLSVLMLLVCALCAAYIYQYFRGASLNRELQQLATAIPEDAAAPATAETVQPLQPEEETTVPPEVPEDATPTWPASVDFAANENKTKKLAEGGTSFRLFRL